MRRERGKRKNKNRWTTDRSKEEKRDGRKGWKRKGRRRKKWEKKEEENDK